MVVCKYFLQGICRFGNNCKFDHVRDYQPQSQYHSNQQQHQHQHQQQHQQQQQQQQYYNQNHNSRDRYSYVSNQQQQQQHHQHQNQHHYGGNRQSGGQAANRPDGDPSLSDADFLKLVKVELNDWLMSPSMWKFSAYSYKKSAPAMPIEDCQDISFEETRFAFYQARASNQLNQYIQEFNAKRNKIVDIINQLCNPNEQTRKFLLDYFHEAENLMKNQSQTSSSSSFQQTSNPVSTSLQTQGFAPNPFMMMVKQKEEEKLKQQQQQQQTINAQSQMPGFFGQSPPTSFSGFGVNPQAQQQQQPQQPAPSANPFSNIVSFASQPINHSTPLNKNTVSFFGGGNPQPATTSVANPFAQIANAAAQTQPASSGFGFGNPAPQTGFPAAPTPAFPVASQPAPSFPTATQPSAFGQAAQAQSGGIYSNVGELTEEDMNEFKAAKFTVGRIPQNPPPRELCGRTN